MSESPPVAAKAELDQVKELLAAARAELDLVKREALLEKGLTDLDVDQAYPQKSYKDFLKAAADHMACVCSSQLVGQDGLITDIRKILALKKTMSPDADLSTRADFLDECLNCVEGKVEETAQACKTFKEFTPCKQSTEQFKALVVLYKATVESNKRPSSPVAVAPPKKIKGAAASPAASSASASPAASSASASSAAASPESVDPPVGRASVVEPPPVMSALKKRKAP